MAQKLIHPGASRQLPLFVTLTTLLGSVLTQVGLALCMLTTLFLTMFISPSNFTSWYYFSGALRQVDGTINLLEATKATEGGRKHHKGTPIYAVHYSFSLDGQKYFGTSYSTGIRYTPGAVVPIEFPPAHPEQSRVKGLRTTLFGSFVLLFILFPLAGAVLACAGIRSGLRAAALLRNGLLTQGTLVRREDTNMRVNNRPVVKLTFDFTAHDGRRYQASSKSCVTDHLEDDAQERILYDPQNPHYNFLVDALPGKPEIDAGGNVIAGPRASLKLIIPVGTIFTLLAIAQYMQQ